MSELTHQERLNTLARGVEVALRKRSQAEGQMAELQNQRAQILSEMEAEQVTPQTLQSEIERLDAEVEGLLREGESLVPWDLIREAV